MFDFKEVKTLKIKQEANQGAHFYFSYVKRKFQKADFHYNPIKKISPLYTIMIQVESSFVFIFVIWVVYPIKRELILFELGCSSTLKCG